MTCKVCGDIPRVRGFEEIDGQKFTVYACLNSKCKDHGVKRKKPHESTDCAIVFKK